MLIPAQNSNKANCKIQDCFADRQIKKDVKCNNDNIKINIKIKNILVHLEWISVRVRFSSNSI
jgi:hypothetical protein